MKIIFAIVFLFITATSYATTYYVATSGNDNYEGSYEKPWATWEKSFNTAKAGDTIFFRGGIYYKLTPESADIIPRDGKGHSGTPDNYIHYLNYPGEVPILDCSLIIPGIPTGDFGYNAGLYIDGANYLHFRGLTIRNVRQVHDRVLCQGLVAVSSKFHIYENMTIYNITGRGVYYSPDYAPDSTYFINCDVYNCIDSLDTGGLPGGWGDGFNAGNEDNSYLSLQGCRVWNCSDDGFNTWGNGLLVVRNCWAFQNGQLGGDGCGFKMNVPNDGADPDLHRIFTNNIATYNSGNTGAGFTENNNGMYTVYSNMYNNTSYKNMTGFTTIGHNVGTQRNNIYRNNIAYNNSQYDDEESQGGVFFTNDHNSWNTELGVTVTDADFVNLDVNQLTRPRKNDGSLPDIDFLRLASTSDLIDKGIDVGLPFNGKTPDLGYREYGILVTEITVTGAGGSATINTDKGTLQMSASVLPANATNKIVNWSVINGTGKASISTSGLLTAIANGSVTARATADDGSGVYGQLVISINNQVDIKITGITVTGADGSTSINTNNGTLQLIATISPADATNKTVIWSVTNGTGQATINSSGLLTAIANGTVTAKAQANDGSGIFGQLALMINNQNISVTSIIISGTGGSTAISIDKGTLQLSATVLPANATNKTVNWSLINGTGQANISSSGLLTAVTNGTVTARATANDGSGIYGQLVITISNQNILVKSIMVTGAGGSTIIDADNGTLQLNAVVIPTNATNMAVTWSVTNGTGQANISSSGLLTAVANGTVTARATANDGSGIYGQLVLTVSNQFMQVTGITVTGAGGSTTIDIDKGMLQLNTAVLPSEATNKTVTWSVTNGTGQAIINSSGLLTAVANGTVTARATANDGSGIYGQLVLTISNQFILVTDITVTGAGGSTTIDIDKGMLQLNAAVLPSEATNKTVTWSVTHGTGQAIINSSGLLTAVANGTVTARATANDGSGIYDQLVLTISNQFKLVTDITVTGAGGSTTIDTDKGMLQLNATVLPSEATNKTVTWSVINGTGQATINSSGMLTAVTNGIITALAKANDGSNVYGVLDIAIIGQTIVTEIDERKNPDFYLVQGPDKLFIKSNNQSVEISNYSVYSIHGRLVQQKKNLNDVGDITIPKLIPGIYVIKITYNDKIFSLKVTIP